MPAYKDQKNKTWMIQLRYRDWSGEKCRKTKRGFPTKKEALSWERKFLETYSREDSISFEALYQNYLNDLSAQLKPQTVNLKKKLFEKRILPYFKQKQVSEITPGDILKWHNELLRTTYGAQNTPLANSYLRTIHNQLNALFNYAVRYCGFTRNPCKTAGTIKKAPTPEMKIWTVSQFQTFLTAVDQPLHRLAFEILFWCGLRKGELLALTPADITPDRVIHITKTYYRSQGEDLFAEPKTPKSRREVVMPEFLYQDYRAYLDSLYGDMENHRLFFSANAVLNKNLDKYAALAGVPRIRVHDLRHSHASLLIEMGFNILAVSQRLGHEKPQTTLNIYGHLYPDKQKELADRLNALA